MAWTELGGSLYGSSSSSTLYSWQSPCRREGRGGEGKGGKGREGRGGEGRGGEGGTEVAEWMREVWRGRRGMDEGGKGTWWSCKEGEGKRGVEGEGWRLYEPAPLPLVHAWVSYLCVNRPAVPRASSCVYLVSVDSPVGGAVHMLLPW